MIRWRVPRKDSPKLVALVIDRLIPLAREARPDTKFSRTEILRRMRSMQVLVACRVKDPSPLGFVAFKVQGGSMTVEMLAVDKRAEGRGLGGALLDAAERHARRKGAVVARLAVDEPNGHAQDFYEHKGYGIERYVPEYRMFVMTKRL